MTLVLVRHAEPVPEARGRCYGSLDVALSDEGQAQAEVLAAALAEARADRIVSSPLLRALETARAVARPHGLRVELLDGLRELDFGEFEGRTYEELARLEPVLYARWMTEPTRVRFPRGESYGDLRERALATIELLRETAREGRVVAVTHAGVVRVVAAELLGIPAERIFRLRIAPASTTVIDWLAGEPVVGPLGVPVGPSHNT